MLTTMYSCSPIYSGWPDKWVHILLLLGLISQFSYYFLFLFLFFFKNLVTIWLLTDSDLNSFFGGPIIVIIAL